MRVSVIVAHPNRASFNHAIATTCWRVLTDNGHEVITHDLYEEHFNPMLPYGEFPKDAVLPADIKRHCDEVSQADGIVIIHPNWWGQPPAILKGWVDRVIRPGVAYRQLRDAPPIRVQLAWWRDNPPRQLPELLTLARQSYT